MEYISGRGFSYHVYDLGNGRVRKIEKNPLEKILYSWPRDQFRLSCLFRLFDRQTVIKSYARLRSVDQSLIGHPSFLQGVDYEQDKVVILEDALTDSGPGEKRALIDAYIKNILACWSFGFADTIFNFSINNGVDTGGNVILTDLNEITWEKAQVERDIATKRWLQAYSYFSFLDPYLRPYYAARMEDGLTCENLDRLWNTKHQTGI